MDIENPEFLMDFNRAKTSFNKTKRSLGCGSFGRIAESKKERLSETQHIILLNKVCDAIEVQL